MKAAFHVLKTGIEDIDLDSLGSDHHIIEETSSSALIRHEYRGGAVEYKVYFSLDDAIAAYESLLWESKDPVDRLRVLLRDDLYDSKDWRSGDLVERVEWLISMYESTRSELDQYLGMLGSES